jgi:hypothetical protein
MNDDDIERKTIENIKDIIIPVPPISSVAIHV